MDDIAKVVLGNFKNRRGSTGSVGGMEDNQVDDETTFLAQSAGLSAPDRVLLEKEREHTVAMNKLKLVIKSRDFKALVTGNRAKDADHALDSMHLPELRRGSQHGVSLEDEAPGLNQPGTGPRQWGGDLTGAAVFNPSIDTIAARFQWWQVCAHGVCIPRRPAKPPSMFYFLFFIFLLTAGTVPSSPQCTEKTCSPGG